MISIGGAPVGQFFTFSVGDLAVIVSLLVTWIKVQSWMNRLAIEHEILIQDYLKRHNLRSHDLPTRARR